MFDDNKGELDEFFKGRELTDGKYILSKEDFKTYLKGMGPQVERTNEAGEKAFKPKYRGTPVVEESDGPILSASSSEEKIDKLSGKEKSCG